MMHQMLVAFLSVVLVAHVRGFNPLPVAPVQRAPQQVQPTRPQSQPFYVPNRPGGHAFMPPTPSQSALSALPPTAETMSTATREADATMPTELEWEQLNREAYEGRPENRQPVVALQAEGVSWSAFASGFAFAFFGFLSAAFLTLRSNLFRQATAGQEHSVEMRQTPFSMVGLLESDHLPRPPLVHADPVYTASSEFGATFQGRLVANFQPATLHSGLRKVKKHGLKAASIRQSFTSLMMARKPIVGGNWKCNPVETAKLPELIANFKPCAESLDKVDVYVCPSNLHLGMVYDKFEEGIQVAPQNCNFKGCGAYTGEMAVDQMVDMGLKWVLIGHSERRGEFGIPTPAESNVLLATKLKYILEKGMNCVLCIGECLAIREKGLAAVIAECQEELKFITPILKDLEDKSRVVIAYEPVWAIGTGVTASPEQAQETHKAIRDYLAKEVDQKTADEIRIQYGGSANAKNAPDLSKQPDIDGFLVGGASMLPDINDIVKAIGAAKA